MTGMKTQMKNEGIPTYIDLDLSAIEVMLDVAASHDYEKYKGVAIPFIKVENGKHSLYWITSNGHRLEESIWTDEQLADAGITEDTMSTAADEVGIDNSIFVPSCGHIYPVSDEIKERIDSRLMKVHERKMNESLSEIVRGLGLEGNYNWTMEEWTLSENVPEDVMRRDAIRMSINPDTQDDWMELLLLMLDEKLNEAE